MENKLTYEASDFEKIYREALLKMSAAHIEKTENIAITNNFIKLFEKAAKDNVNDLALSCLLKANKHNIVGKIDDIAMFRKYLINGKISEDSDINNAISHLAKISKKITPTLKKAHNLTFKKV